MSTHSTPRSGNRTRPRPKSRRNKAWSQKQPLEEEFVGCDEDNLERVLDTFRPRLRRAIAAKYGSVLTEDELEDVVLTALFRAWIARGQFDAALGSLFHWLRTIALREAADRLRAGWRQVRLHERLWPADELNRFETTGRTPAEVDGEAALLRRSTVRRLLCHGLMQLPILHRVFRNVVTPTVWPCVLR